MKQTISRAMGRKRSRRRAQQPRNRAGCAGSEALPSINEALTAGVFLPMYIHFLPENYGLVEIAKDS